MGQTKHVCRLDQAKGHQFAVSGLELFSELQEVKSVLVCKGYGEAVSRSYKGKLSDGRVLNWIALGDELPVIIIT